MRLSLRFVSLLALCWLPEVSGEVKEEDKFYSDLKLCPAACQPGGSSSNWTVYHDTKRLAVCDQPVLLTFNLYTAIDDPSKDVTIRSCTAGNADSTENMSLASQALSSHTEKRPKAPSPEVRMHDNGRRSGPETQQNHEICDNSSNFSNGSELLCWGSNNPRGFKDVIIASQKIQDYIKHPASSNKTVIMVNFKGTLVGLYSGESVKNLGAAEDFVQRFIEHVEADGIATRKALQVCGKNRTSHDFLGIVADTTGNFAAVQDVMRLWNDAKCVGKAYDLKQWSNSTASSLAPEPEHKVEKRFTYRGHVHGHVHRHGHGHNHVTHHHARDDGVPQNVGWCRTTRVWFGADCASLAAECKISGNDFMKYNAAKSDLCSTLNEGQSVCCSPGGLPDRGLKPTPDGRCAWTEVHAQEYCQIIASSNGLEIEDLEQFNKQTWGWTGCGNLQEGLRICLGKGKPPMPAPVTNAVCGPTVPGTQPPSSDDQTLADLNACPLNACCNVWGQCGTTSEFCTKSKSATGNPGTSKPRENGCISNCGTDIKRIGEQPSQFMKLGYFEAWNYERPCLNMNVERIDRSYTHVHFAFGEITSDFKVAIPKNLTEQWNGFKKIPQKKILAFGGWSFSTNYDTAPIFGKAVSSVNRDLFAQNVVLFAIDNGLDGLDFDWEYPGATDIDNVPGSPADGANYVMFLQAVGKRLPEGMTLSIAAPASFWYLKAFPIRAISRIVDYIVYMTYDLHGQWDAGNRWASPGCPSGNCLRSHVNWTETYNSLSMITKAGVPTNKIVVGVSSYGRSFKMADRTCRGPDCFFIGSRSESAAAKGACTGTAGYISNAEIDQIIAGGYHIEQWRDDTDSDYLIYGDNEWVAYMSDQTKNNRATYYRSQNFAGTSDWAIDLQKFLIRGGDPMDWDGSDNDAEKLLELYPICNQKFKTFEELEGTFTEPHCGPQYTLSILARMASTAIDTYNKLIKNGYDDYYDLYADYMVSESTLAAFKFLETKGNKYFNCKVVEEITCCRGCEDKNGKGASECKYCDLDMCSKATPWGTTSAWKNFSEPCPPDMSKRGYSGTRGHKYQSIFWDLPSDYSERFWADISADTGVPSNKFIWGHSSIPGYMTEFPDRECDKNGIWSKDSCSYTNYWFGIPMVHNFTKEDFYNPKIVVDKALKQAGNLGDELDAITWGLIAGQIDNAKARDIIDAVSVPVLMIDEALKAMKNAAEMGKKIEEANKKTLILNILMCVFFLLPAAGEAIGTLGLSTLARALVTLGELGNIGQGIFDIVQHPSNAPLAIFGIVLSAGALKDVSKIGKAAEIRRGLSDSTVTSMGGSVAKRLSVIRNRIGPETPRVNLCK